jgi:hypothetical protein
MHKQQIKSLLGAGVRLVLCFYLSACASIVSGGPKKITINTTPAGAKVTVYDRTGKVVSTNQTPAVVSLERSHGYFKGEDYRIVIEKPGYRRTEVSVQATINGWYFGNLAIGGVIGMLVVDPLTGAMYTLEPDHIEQTLTPTERAGGTGGGHRSHFGIILKEQLTAEQLRRLKPLTAQR